MVIKIVDYKSVLKKLEEDFQFDPCQDNPQFCYPKGVSLIILHTDCSRLWCEQHALDHLYIDYLFISTEPAVGLPPKGILSISKKNCFICEYPAGQLHKNKYFIEFIDEYIKGNKRWDLLKYPSPEHLIALYLLDIPFTNPPAKGFKKDFEKSAKQIWDSIHGNAVKEFGHCKNKFGNEISCTGLPDSWEDHEGRRKCIAEVLSIVLRK